jgi:integrase
MAGIRVRISRATVNGLKRGDWVTDTVLPGFKVRRPNRLALYGLNIRLQGRMRWISLGTEAELTPDQARSEAERIRGLKRQGQDPASDRDRRKGAISIEAAVVRFMAEHVRRKLKPRTAAHYAETFDRLIRRHFGRWRVDSLSEGDVAQWHANMMATPTQANRALAILSSLMTWTVRRKWRDTNPCRGVPRFKERAIIRYPTPGDLARIADAMDELVAEGALNLFFATGAKILMMTGARRSEIFEAEWSWLDVERRCLVLPDSKTGTKIVTLPGAAMELLAQVPRLNNCPWIFPSIKTDRPFVNFHVQWKLVLRRAGVGHWRLHDLRHGFASTAVSAGASLYAVGRQLGHAKPQTTTRYSHLSDSARRELTETVAALICERRGPEQ